MVRTWIQGSEEECHAEDRLVGAFDYYFLRFPSALVDYLVIFTMPINNVLYCHLLFYDLMTCVPLIHVTNLLACEIISSISKHI